MKFFVNFLSAFRIAASFAIIPTLMFQLYWTSLILFVLGALSDFFDGYLARKYDVCTKIGGVMDHIGDTIEHTELNRRTIGNDAGLVRCCANNYFDCTRIVCQWPARILGHTKN